MVRLVPSMLVAAALVSTFWAVKPARAADPPADPCSLLPASDVARITGKNYNPPQSSAAPRPYANTNAGTDCTYAARGSGDQLLFRVYFDNSPAQATDLFAKLRMFYSPPTPVPGIGDDAYFDPRHAIHVRKGKVRYFLQLGDAEANQKALSALAALVAGKL